jgi:hypothetical protein
VHRKLSCRVLEMWQQRHLSGHLWGIPQLALRSRTCKRLTTAQGEDLGGRNPHIGNCMKEFMQGWVARVSERSTGMEAMSRTEHEKI